MSGFDFHADVRSRLFSGQAGRWRVGAEIELIALDRRSSRPAAVESAASRPGLLALLRELAEARGWRERRNGYGIPGFRIPAVGVLSFEPGGQLELSTRPFSSPSRLLAAIRGTTALLMEAGDRADIEFLEAGLDPFNAPADASLAFPVERYTRMAAHFLRIGGDGLRMMKQTASCQISVDAAPAEVFEAWRVLNAMTPAAIAAFANSPVLSGKAGGELSARARIWQNTDPLRTGVFNGADPVQEYCAFALAAPSFLHGDGPAGDIREMLDTQPHVDAIWQQHLSTLFPEVRPRGYLEFRACDMVGDDARGALLLLLCAVARDASARRAIGAIAGPLDHAAYAAAPLAGAELLTRAGAALQVALASARREPAGFWHAPDLLRAERFMHDYTLRGRSPAADWRPPLLRSA